jgi:Ig-like domain-containing protein
MKTPRRGMLRLGCLALSFAIAGLLVSCSSSSQPAVCDSNTCPTGCCQGDVCIDPTVATACGTGAAACQDCTSDLQTDSCSSGACICQAEGQRCGMGEECTPSGCQGCQPACAGKCAGADDGCQGTCPTDDCTLGCCNSGHQCIAYADQTAASCGTSAAACSDCGSALETDACSQGACVCQATGSACSSGQECGAQGCGCAPDCENKCAGADDGCLSTCPSTTCLMGCCTAARECLGHSGLGDTECGPVGQDCVDCTESDMVCANFTCVDDIANNAVFVDQSVPAAMNPGQQIDVTISMQNTGTATWSVASEHKLGAQNPQDNSTWGFNRVVLEVGDSIEPGQSKTFSFQVTAPANPGVYNFQWRMLQESVEWFGEFSPNVIVTVGTQNITVCEAARALAGTQTDASGVIQTCIDNSAANAIVELPAGIYRIDHQIQINDHPITLRTEGKDQNMAKCAIDNHDCAELKASTDFSDTLGILQVHQNSSLVDHLVVNGNKTARASTSSGQECASYSNSYGYNIRLTCNSCAVFNSVTKNALCGTGLEGSGVRSGLTIWRNTVAYNGVHDSEGLWADGITIHDAVDSSFTENEFVDSTDIDLIFGGCVNCIIQDNVIWHTDNFAGGAFAALMIHAWSDGNGGNATSGNFTGSVTSGNSIDCGAQRRCGIGLYLGSDAWYITDVYGGSVHDNTVANAEMGVLIDDVHDMEVYDNPVSNPALFTTASCGQKWTHAYAIGNRSANVDTSKDTLSTVYTDVDFDFCIPNWWNP